jgi:peptidoglycan/LPS O-acetylase OafA/YrhL
MMVSIMHWGLELGPERMLQVYELPVIGFLIENGGLGVDIFFLISGCFVTSIWRHLIPILQSLSSVFLIHTLLNINANRAVQFHIKCFS